MSETNQQVMLPFGNIVTETISKVFAAKPITSKDKTVGTSITLAKRADIAAALQLQPKADKDKLDAAILEASDEAFRKVKSEIAGLNGDWTLAKVANRTVGKGIRQVTMVIREIKRNTGPSDEAIAKAWFPDAQFPGMTLEEKVAKVIEMRENQQKQLAAQNVEEQN